MKTTIYRWAKSRGIVPQTAYGWRTQGLPTDDLGRVDPEEADNWRQARTPRHRPQVSNSAYPAPPDLAQLATREEEAIIKGLSSLAFVRAQGRTLFARSQETFVDFIWNEAYSALGRVTTQAGFDEIHDRWVGRLQRLLKTSRGEVLSYGQGQKSLNVALKFIVDWAARPDQETAEALRPLPHCPLDRVVMNYLRLHDVRVFSNRVRPLYRGIYGPN